MARVIKEYPEFGYSVEYKMSDDLSGSKNGSPLKEIDWIVRSSDGEYLMSGKFKSDNYYRSTFDLPISNMEENMYENLFYLYFENIKLDCISMVEEGDEDIVEENEDIL